MKIGELRTKLGNCYSVAHLRRWAHDKKIPGAKQLPGGHFRFRSSPKLNEWISDTIRERALARNAVGLRKRARTPRVAIEREWNDFGVTSPLEITRQFLRDFEADSNSRRGHSPKMAKALLSLLAPIFTDLTARAQIHDLPSRR